MAKHKKRRRKLFVELFSAYVIDKCRVIEDIFEDKQFFAASIYWREYIRRNRPDDCNSAAEMLYDFGQGYFCGDEHIYVMSPDFGQFLEDISFDNVPLAPRLHGSSCGYCIEFPEVTVFCDDAESVFWQSVVATIQHVEDQYQLSLLFPDYDSTGEMGGGLNTITQALDSSVSIQKNIEILLDDICDQHVSHRVIEYAVKCLFYLHSLSPDTKGEKGLRLINDRNTNPLKTPARSAYDIIHVGKNLDGIVRKNKGNPKWSWIKDSRDGVDGLRLHLE